MVADYIEYHQNEYKSIDQLATNIVNKVFDELYKIGKEETIWQLIDHQHDQHKDHLTDQQLDQLLDQQWDQLKDHLIDQKNDQQ